MTAAPTVLVVGAGGQVGWELLRRVPAGIHVAGRTRADLDITDAAAVADIVAVLRPAAVINAAAYTAVDKAESEPARAFAVNRDGAAHLAAACTDAGIPLIHISTDYVFDGSKAAAYTEDDPVCPVSVYGTSKEAGEAAVRTALPHHVILRTAWVYGVHGRNFVKTMLQLVRTRPELRVVADQYGCPTAAGDIADAIWTIVARIQTMGAAFPWGTYHYCGAGQTTWHGFAEAIVDLAAPTLPHPVTVTPITTADYPTPAKRPANSVLDCNRIAAALAIRPRAWREALAQVMAELSAAPAP